MRLNEATIAISGLGLMGGSMALALRGKCKKLIGVARRAEVVERAISTGVVDDAGRDLRAAAREVDIVVLATPLRDILASIPIAGACMRQGALLMDLGSAKANVVEAMNNIPEWVAAVGGHPMCGKETGGLENADASLFNGAIFALTPTARTTGEAMLLAHELVEATGARPFVLEAERHDRATAVISHLPYLIASALMQAEQEASARDPAVAMLAASGFRDTTRLAASQVDMMSDTLLNNRESLIYALDLLEEKLAEVRGLLDQPPGLRDWMATAQRGRRDMFP